jgi:hypothetical protein
VIFELNHTQICEVVLYRTEILPRQDKTIAIIYTETCQKYSVTVIFYYIFHIKPQFLKTLFQSQFLFDFDEIFTNRSENVRIVFCDYFKIFFGSTDFKCSWFKHKLKLFVFKYTIIVLYFWRSKFSFVFKSLTHKNYRL